MLTIRQKEGESLRSYVKRVDEVEDKVQLTTFKARLKSRSLW